MCICIVSLVIAASGCAAQKEVVLSLEGNENITLRKNQILQIELQSNPTTGYSWAVLSTDTNQVIQQLGEPSYEAGTEAKKGLVGAGGIEIYRFQAMKEGKAILVFQYSRPWEKDVEPAKRYVVQVTISD